MISSTVKTGILFGSLGALMVLIGGLIGGSNGLLIAFCISLMAQGILYFFSESIALHSYGAQPLDPNQYPDIHADVHDLARAMQIPMPKLWIINHTMANALATGRNPHHASIAFTTGILSLLSHQELRGIIAHELSHIKNRDTLIGTTAAIMASTIGYLAYMLRSLSWWSLNSRNQEKSKGIPLDYFTLFFVSILVPIAATILQLTISRAREHQADETGAYACKDPLALATALEKLHQHIPQAHLSHDDLNRAGTASLFIVHPFFQETWVKLFSTHPPMAERIAHLQEIHKKMYPYQNNLR